MKDTKSKNITAWYWYSGIGILGTTIGGLVGGGAGALITILLGHIFLLISLVTAISGGIKGGRTDKVSAGSRISAFFVALLIALIGLFINSALAQ